MVVCQILVNTMMLVDLLLVPVNFVRFRSMRNSITKSRLNPFYVIGDTDVNVSDSLFVFHWKDPMVIFNLERVCFFVF